MSANGSHAYVTNFNYTSASVAVIDITTAKVIATIPTGTYQSFGVAVSPDKTVAHLTDYSAGTVMLIDTATSTPLGDPVPIGGANPAPFGIAVTARGEVYITNGRNGNLAILTVTG